MVINLPSRRERLERFNTEIVKLFDSNNTETINGVIDKVPMKGIATAHLNAICRAKELKLPYVLVMEDDLFVQSLNSRTQMEAAFSEVPDDFEILLGGIYTAHNLKKYNNYWDSVDEFSALHFYVVNSNVYDKILSFDKTEHIDRWMAKIPLKAGGGLKSYVSNPFFCIQYPGFSDNVMSNMDYSHLLKKFNVLK